MNKLRPAVDPSEELRRAELIKLARKQRAGIKALFDDQDHWNRVNPDKKPIDVDQDGSMKKLAAQLDEFLKDEVYPS